jgi:hypothetical protein
MYTSRIRHLLILIVVFCSALLFSVPIAAAPLPRPQLHPQPPVADQCRDHKLVADWHSRRAIEAKGFNFDIIGDQARVDFGRTMSLSLASDPSSSTYTASRMTEVDSNAPIDERVKCWQATPKKNVVVEFRVRFKRTVVPPWLTENMILWNAPLPLPNSTEQPHPSTAIGLSRNNFAGTPVYQAVVAQDVRLSPMLFQSAPVPAWLDPTEWHRVRITLSQQVAQVEVAQGAHPFTVLVQATLLHPAEPLAFEFSVDNEVRAGETAPVLKPDSLEVSFLKMDMVPVHHN